MSCLLSIKIKKRQYSKILISVHLSLPPLASSSPCPPHNDHPSVRELEVVTLLPVVLLALRRNASVKL